MGKEVKGKRRGVESLTEGAFFSAKLKANLITFLFVYFIISFSFLTFFSIFWIFLSHLVSFFFPYFF